MSRTHRVTAAFAALAGLVLGLLVCGTVTAGAQDRSAVTVAGAPADGPGCDRGHGGAEGAAAPAVPPRPHGFGDLLPAPAGARTPCGGWGAEQDAAEAPPGPEPPALAPPSPVELSILRV
ncbi:hypothetical protein [Streptomyces sp. NPDC053431]|uniref:hypothetical protein n=1 Tax=Streptomyces sp. NPDC053431 TaxID=3365703 RepID=UPI0037CFB1BA